MEILNPEYILSTLAGGGFCWAAAKIHLQYISEKIKKHDDQIEKINDRLTLHTSDHKVHNHD